MGSIHEHNIIYAHFWVIGSHVFCVTPDLLPHGLHLHHSWLQCCRWLRRRLPDVEDQPVVIVIKHLSYVMYCQHCHAFTYMHMTVIFHMPIHNHLCGWCYRAKSHTSLITWLDHWGQDAWDTVGACDEMEIAFIGIPSFMFDFINGFLRGPQEVMSYHFHDVSSSLVVTSNKKSPLNLSNGVPTYLKLGTRMFM